MYAIEEYAYTLEKLGKKTKKPNLDTEFGLRIHF